MKLFNKLFAPIRPDYRHFSEVKNAERFMWEGIEYVKLNDTHAYQIVGDAGVMHHFGANEIVQRIVE